LIGEKIPLKFIGRGENPFEILVSFVPKEAELISANAERMGIRQEKKRSGGWNIGMEKVVYRCTVVH